MILHRLPGSKFSTVEPLWAGGVVIIIAGGPSVTRADVELVRQARARDAVRVIVVNDAFLLAPWADVSYAADLHWHGWMQKGIAKPELGLSADDVRRLWREFRGEKCSIQNGSGELTDPDVHVLRNETFPHHADGLSADRGALRTGRNSGFQALGLAVHAGADLVLLLGFDGKPGADGKTHWHGEHPRPTPAAVWPLVRQSFAMVTSDLEKAGVEVINCSPGTAIGAFPKSTMKGALEVVGVVFP